MVEPGAPDRCERAVTDTLREIDAADLGVECPAIWRIWT